MAEARLAGILQWELKWGVRSHEVTATTRSRRIPRAFLAALFLAVTSSNLRAQTLDDILAAVDSTVSSRMTQDGGVGLAVGVVRNDDTVFIPYGETVRGSGQKPNASTLFQIGSITKTFVATLLALSVERGVVHYDDPLQLYVPGGVRVPDYKGRQITLRDLATHTAALPRDATPGPNSTSLDEMYAFLNSFQLIRPPGELYQYSNLGFALLAEALARAHNTSWESLLRRDILSILNMRDTVVDPAPSQIALRAQGYRRSGRLADWNLPTWPAAGGAGALYSSMDDMLKYLAWNMGHTKNSLSSVLDDIHRPQHRASRNGQIALGWEISDLGDCQVIWKTGGTDGFSSYIAFIPDANIGMVVLANSMQSTRAVANAAFALFSETLKTQMVEAEKQRLEQAAKRARLGKRSRRAGARAPSRAKGSR